MTTREKLIQVTSALIREKGISATGMAEIIEISGIPKGSVYHHFPSGKEELVASSLYHFRDLMSAAFRSSIKGKSTASLGLKAIIDFYIRELEASQFRNGCPLAIAALESSGIDDHVQTVCKEVMDYWIENLVSYFKHKGLEAGRPEAEEFIVRLEGSLLLCQVYQHTRFLQHLKKQIKDIIHE